MATNGQAERYLRIERWLARLVDEKPASRSVGVHLATRPASSRGRSRDPTCGCSTRATAEVSPR
jgi:hypothetical protein